jgi:hypothetical protein
MSVFNLISYQEASIRTMIVKDYDVTQTEYDTIVIKDSVTTPTIREASPSRGGKPTATIKVNGLEDPIPLRARARPQPSQA